MIDLLKALFKSKKCKLSTVSDSFPWSWNAVGLGQLWWTRWQHKMTTNWVNLSQCSGCPLILVVHVSGIYSVIHLDNLTSEYCTVNHSMKNTLNRIVCVYTYNNPPIILNISLYLASTYTFFLTKRQSVFVRYCGSWVAWVLVSNSRLSLRHFKNFSRGTTLNVFTKFYFMLYC